jgi:hypothetical protein
MKDRVGSMLRANLRLVAACVAVAVISGTTVAVAGNMISGKRIKNGTITMKKLHKKLRKRIKRHARGRVGPQGPQGPPGANGSNGQDATYQGPHWGLIDRNTTGTGIADLRAGPFTGPSAPPFGDGSLGIETTSTEKASFGDEVDFAGDPVSGLSQVGFYVYSTGEDQGYGANNQPNITLEINPSVAGKDYTSMVYNAQTADTVTNGWSGYLDTTAAATANRGWWFTNSSVGTATNCTQAHFCSLSEAQAALDANNDGGAAASILSVAVGKGTDFQYQGAVDGLRINDTIYDFEPFGVIETPAA